MIQYANNLFLKKKKRFILLQTLVHFITTTQFKVQKVNYFYK